MESPDFDSMSKNELLVLIKKIRNSLIGCEDAEGECCWLAELLHVDVTCDAENEESV